MKPKSSACKKVVTVLVIICALLLAVFFIGRYGWKLGGFQACQSAGIEQVEVTRGQVKITGFYPGSFPEEFLGYHAKETNGKLYVGFRFSALFGIFETGDFEITIPTKGEIKEVIVKTRMNEYSIWTAAGGAIMQSERYGVYVKLEPNDVYTVNISYDSDSGDASVGSDCAPESGEYLYLDSDIMYKVKESGGPVPFTLTVRKADGSVVASGSFVFKANMEKMYLTVTSDGQITEQKK